MLADQEHTSYTDTNPFHQVGAPLSQTPGQCFFRCHFLACIIIASISNFLINFLLTFLSFLSYDRTGLWRSESFVTIDGHRVYYTDAPIFVDLLLTTFLLGLLVTVFMSGGVRKSIIAGRVLPIPAQEYRGALRYLGVTVRNVFARGAIFGVWCVVVVYSFTILFLHAACSNGTLRTFTPPGSESAHCYMTDWQFIPFKAGWSALLTAAVYPLIYLAALNRDTLSDDEYQAFLRVHDAGGEPDMGSEVTVPTAV